MKNVAIILLILLFFVAVWLYLSYRYPTTTPFKSALFVLEHLFKPHTNMKKQLIGFLPYWRVENIANARLDILTEVNYFSLSVDKNGKIIKVVNGQTDPGWREWTNPAIKDMVAKTQIMGGKYTVTIAALRNSIIEDILKNQDAQKTLISEISDLVKTNRLDGINIDFEYSGEPDAKYKHQFTAFAKELSTTLRKESPNIILEMSIMPTEMRGKSIFDFPELAPVFDTFIGMTYDFYGQSADIAGPVAPMTGFEEKKFFFDVTTTYEDYARYLPKNKIVMGIPYYGWDWAVEDGKKIQSKTFPDDDPKNYSAILSYGRMREERNLKPAQCQWDDYAQENWCWYTKDNVDHQVWFEDNRSIGIKYDYVKKQNLSGAAIWVLGYDKTYSDLWNIVKEKFTK